MVMGDDDDKIVPPANIHFLHHSIPGSRLEMRGKRVTRDGITDGPFAEAKELVGGYWFIVADSLEDAARIAAQNPCLAFGLELEIRPLEAARARADEVTNETPPAWRSNDD